MKKPLQIAFIIVFLGLCALPLAGWIFGYENVSAEKRALAEMPAFVGEDGLNTAFTNEFDDYYTDNFAFRSDLITMHAHFESAVFSRSVTDDVIVGKDGWLFFTPTLKDYTKTDVLTDNEIYRMVKTLQIQQTALEKQGIEFIFTVAPNKASVYGEFMPDRYITVEDMNNAQMLYEALEDTKLNYVDLHGLLQDGQTQLYHKLDSHWNGTGAMIAYHALMDAVQTRLQGFAYQSYALDDYTVAQTWRGDLGDMLYPSAGVLDDQHVYGVDEEYTSARPIRSMEDMKIAVTCDTGNLHALMFRDSFANALIPLLSNEFASMTYSRATPYDYRLMNEDTDVVILEIVERNLPNLLNAAPILPAFAVDLNVDTVQADLSASSVTAVDDGQTVTISGTVVPADYSADTNYEVYVCVSSGEEDTVFVPFPILEGMDSDAYANTVFTTRIPKEKMPDGDFTIGIILFDQNAYYTDTLLTSDDISSP